MDGKVPPTGISPAMLAAGMRVYRKWESENMLDGEEPSMAGPSAVRDLIRAILDLSKGNSPVAEEDTNGQATT